MNIREATLLDIKALADIEKEFCLPRNLPPEGEAGAHWFLQNGGRVYLYDVRGSIHAAFWVIAIGTLRNLPTTGLPITSPIRAVRACETIQSAIENDLLVYSWTPVGKQSKWIYRWIMQIFLKDCTDNVYGFVSCPDENKVLNYLRMGCKIIGSVPDLYGDKNAHFVLFYPSHTATLPRVNNERDAVPAISSCFCPVNG